MEIQTTKKQDDRPEVKVIDSRYQLTCEALRENLWWEGRFEDAIKALVQPVRIERVMSLKR